MTSCRYTSLDAGTLERPCIQPVVFKNNYQPRFAVPDQIRLLNADWASCQVLGHMRDPPLAMSSVRSAITTKSVPDPYETPLPGLAPHLVPLYTGIMTGFHGGSATGSHHQSTKTKSAPPIETGSALHFSRSEESSAHHAQGVSTALEPSITIGPSVFRVLPDLNGNGGALILGPKATLVEGDPATVIDGTSVSVGKSGVVVGNASGGEARTIAFPKKDANASKATDSSKETNASREKDEATGAVSKITKKVGEEQGGAGSVRAWFKSQWHTAGIVVICAVWCYM